MKLKWESPGREECGIGIHVVVQYCRMLRSAGTSLTSWLPQESMALVGEATPSSLSALLGFLEALLDFWYASQLETLCTNPTGCHSEISRLFASRLEFDQHPAGRILQLH